MNMQDKIRHSVTLVINIWLHGAMVSNRHKDMSLQLPTPGSQRQRMLNHKD